MRWRCHFAGGLKPDFVFSAPWPSKEPRRSRPDQKRRGASMPPRDRAVGRCGRNDLRRRGQHLKWDILAALGQIQHGLHTVTMASTTRFCTLSILFQLGVDDAAWMHVAWGADSVEPAQRQFSIRFDFFPAAERVRKAVASALGIMLQRIIFRTMVLNPRARLRTPAHFFHSGGSNLTSHCNFDLS